MLIIKKQMLVNEKFNKMRLLTYQFTLFPVFNKKWAQVDRYQHN